MMVSELSHLGDASMFGLGQSYMRGSGHHQGAHSGPPSLSYGNQALFGLGQSYMRGSGHHQGAHSGPPSLSYGNQALFGLGQSVVARGAGHHQGGHFGPPSLSYGNQALFGFGDDVFGIQGPGRQLPGVSLPSGDESLFGLGAGPMMEDRASSGGAMFGEGMFGLGGPMMPGSEGGAGAGEGLFGLGDILDTDTAKTVRDLANFAAAAGGAVLAISMVAKGKPMVSNVAFGALGAGLGVMSLIALGLVTKQIKL